MSTDTRKPHILVTDDSLTVRMMLKDQLEEAGYQVSVFTDGEECLNYLKGAGQPPDLVLLDLLMPGVDGITVLRWIKDNCRDAFTPVILLTSLNEVDDRVRGLDHGADDYIAKPFENDELQARVRVQLRIKRLQDELARQNTALAVANEEKAGLLEELADKNEELARLATTDPLTGLANRGHIVEFLQEEVTRTARFNHPLTVAMVDIDHFKTLNDTQGHLFGDQVIQEVTGVFADCVRQVDRVGRYGGEEFLLVMPETELAGGRTLCERICVDVARLEPDGRNVTVTISVGIACWDGSMDGWEELVGRADQALYEAKAAGRNRVICWEPDMDKAKVP